MTVAERLAALRRESGLSRAELARRSGLTTMTIFNVETGRTEPSFRTACAIAKGLTVPVQALCAPEVTTGQVADSNGASGSTQPQGASVRTGASMRHPGRSATKKTTQKG